VSDPQPGSTPTTPRDTRRYVETVTRVDPTITALPPIPQTPVGNGIKATVLVRVLDDVLDGAVNALIWWHRLGDLDALDLPAALKSQWEPLCAFERGCDLVARLRGSRRPLNGERHLHRYLAEHRVAPRFIGRAADILLAHIQETRQQREAPPPVHRRRPPRVNPELKALQNRARFRQSLGE